MNIKNYSIKKGLYEKFMRYKYHDWEDNEYNCGDLKFIWGIKSADDLTNSEPNFYTMNDIDITYNRKTGLYSLGIETSYLFDDGKRSEAAYLNGILKKFTEFMEERGYNISAPYVLWMSQPTINCFAESIPELYTQFRIFVEGYAAVYGE